MLDEKYVIEVLNILERYDILALLYGEIRVRNFIEIIELLKSPVLSDRVNEILNYIINFPGNMAMLTNEKGYLDLRQAIK